jgi:hypothetical protein
VLRFKLFLFGLFSAGFFFLCYCVYAQAIPDSLMNKLHNATDDSIKIRTMLDIGESSEATSITTSLNYYRQAFASAQN